MINFIEYVISELKHQRLSKADAVALVQQFGSKVSREAPANHLHPFVHVNSSNVTQQRYTSSFDGSEFFLRDHQIGGNPTLPGVVYLEMARAAIVLALPPNAREEYQLLITDVAWLNPFQVRGRADISIVLRQIDIELGPDSALHFEIVSTTGEEDFLHCRGVAKLTKKRPQNQLDLAAIKARMRDQIGAKSVYEKFSSMGIQYGPAHRTIHVIHRGDGEVLVELQLPADEAIQRSDVTLHSSIADGALQGIVALARGEEPIVLDAKVPFALDSIRILAACKRQMYAWVRFSQQEQIDVDLFDENGNVAAEMRGFAARKIDDVAISISESQSVSESKPVALLALRQWCPSEPIESSKLAASATHRVLFCGFDALQVQSLQQQISDAKISILVSEKAGLAEYYADIALQCFELLKQWQASGEHGKVQLVAADTIPQRQLVGLLGLFQSAYAESNAFIPQVLLIDPTIGATRLLQILDAERTSLQEVVRYDGSTRQALMWRQFEPDSTALTVPLKQEGIYLITGGLGGLGRLFARQILRASSDAKIILTGRTEQSPQQLQTIFSLAELRRISYCTMDLSDQYNVNVSIQRILANHQRIDGIIHCAGMTDDGFMRSKSATQFREVLAPKLNGTLHLDEASKDLDLDFFALFSSLVGTFGNVGQSDYAAANGFLDSFAEQRNQQSASGVRKGVCVSFAWPLWRDGGMQISAENVRGMAEQSGMEPLGTEAGFEAFLLGLNSAGGHLAVAYGDSVRIARTLFDTRKRPAQLIGDNTSDPEEAIAGDTDALLLERTQHYLRKAFSTVLKVASHDIDADTPLEQYGIDSILALNLIKQLEPDFGTLSKTLLFEHQTIASLSSYLLRSYRHKLVKLFGSESSARSANVAQPRKPIPARNATPRFAQLKDVVPLSRPKATAPLEAEAIAIVGLSGRYPKSKDVHQLWENLRDGIDCISEVPPERWNWQDYYSDDRSKTGHHFSKWGGFIDGIDEFDPLFFNIAPREAALIDPQERVFLQHAWMAIEDAGYTRQSLQIPHEDDLPGQVGVYVGVMYGEYQLFGAQASLLGERTAFAGNLASIANRLSYFLNIHGPSMTVDTMCSSSLTAIHLACQDLKLGRTNLAIAGGVNLTVHPNKYLMLSAGQFISGEGHCQSFGEGGDGYIPGEGVGVVVLKRLSDAIRDRDQIYAVVRGSSLNHGGKTNGYTVPNPQAQSSVISRALKESGYDARHISYIEAHGTGTKLGDPIEISALSQSFFKASEQGLENRFAYCPIGSAKSNIGHCESAAGIAGLTKVILQMQHGQIAPSLHSSTLNPHIDFAHSPFVVNQTLTDWERPVIDNRVVPRVAGISSFGAGGSNAHLIVEEFIAPTANDTPVDSQNTDLEELLPLSALTSEALLSQAKNLLHYLETKRQVSAQGDIQFVGNGKAITLSALASTLQTARETMSQRICILANSIDELVRCLSAFVRGDHSVDGLFVGRTNRSSQDLTLISRDDDIKDALSKWIKRRKLNKLAELWVNGMPLEWERLYPSRQRDHLRLPSYPFADDKYWIDLDQLSSVPAATSFANLPPILHANISDFNQQAYRSEFQGNEFFLKDHRLRISGTDSLNKVLPASAYIELIRAALSDAAHQQAQSAAIVLKRLEWRQPCIVNGRQQIDITLLPNSSGDVQFTVGGNCAGNSVAEYCTGFATFAEPKNTHIDLNALRQSANLHRISGDELYNRLTPLGVDYGPSFRCVRTIFVGEDHALAELEISAEGMAQLERYAVHPGLVDAALQTSFAFFFDSNSADLRVPLSLDEIVIERGCHQRMFAVASLDENTALSSTLIKLNIDLCDSDGVVCVRMRGLALGRISSQQSAPAIETGLFTPDWQALASKELESSPFVGRSRIIIVHGFPQFSESTATLAQAIGVDSDALLHTLQSAEIAADFNKLAMTSFEQVKALVSTSANSGSLLQIVIADSDSNLPLSGLSALLKTAHHEKPGVYGQVIQIPETSSINDVAKILADATSRYWCSELRYRNDMAYAKVWRERSKFIAGVSTEQSNSYRERGCYLITGGLGEIGKIVARDVLLSSPFTKVVLSGRSELDDRVRAALNEFIATFSTHSSESIAPRVLYRQLVLDSASAVESGVQSVVDELGYLNGVFHCAGTTSDNYIQKKDRAEFAFVQTPKVQGTVNLDAATAAVELDFFVLFSSVSSVTGNAGQADYAAANGFMDSFAFLRNVWVQQSKRHGKSISINWPLWQSGGMRLSDKLVAALFQSKGIRPLESSDAIAALHYSLSSSDAQLAVLNGDLDTIKRTLLKAEEPVPVSASKAVYVGDAGDTDDGNTPASQEALLALATSELISLFASRMKIPKHRVRADAPLEEYGIDSVLAMNLTAALEKRFGPLSKTLFFEYQSIEQLASYFCRHHSDQLQSLTKPTAQSVAQPKVRDRAAFTTKTPTAISNRFSLHTGATENGVAIVGISGRYPMADNLNEFWENLVNGRDCIEEIPKQRWNNEIYFNADKHKAGKTYSKWGGFLKHCDHFDPLFFNMSSKEAAIIDPQERLFMEVAWETIEDAGYSRDSIAGSRTGVFVGVMWGQYELYYDDNASDKHVPSSSFASIANRVSYLFDFSGPSMAIDTMCSSSLTAIHLASEAIRRDEIDAAIAGGVNLSLHPHKYLNLSQGGFHATDGRCRSFGAGGDGYVPGEGVGAVYLKSLQKAVEDGDHIYGVVKSSSVNHGGKTNGYTVPNPNRQAELIHATLQKAKVSASDISYVEAHGTGTALGDPIEITGLMKAFEPFDTRQQFCPIGSVKSNIGHLESAAGIAALTKVLLQFKFDTLVPSLHSDTLNPNINFDKTPFYVQTKRQEWRNQNGQRRIAAISSFGAGGSNAHLLVEEPPVPPQRMSHGDIEDVFVLSAKSVNALRHYVERTIEYLDGQPSVTLPDLAFTARVGRSTFKYRLAIISQSLNDLREKLSTWLASNDDTLADEDIYSNERGSESSDTSALLGGDAGEAFMRVLIGQKDLHRLSQLWVNGAAVKWSDVFVDSNVRRVSMPTYPFENDRYWIGTQRNVERTALLPSPVNNATELQRKPIDSISYITPVWREVPLPVSGNDSPRFFVIFDPACTGLLPSNALLRDGDRVMHVHAGEEYSEHADNSITLNVGIDEHYERLSARIEQLSGLPVSIVYLAPEDVAELDCDALSSRIENAFFPLFHLVKSVVRQKPRNQYSIVSIYQTSQFMPDPVSAAVTGFFASVALESTRLQCKLIEIQSEERTSSVKAIDRVLAQELRATSGSHERVRYCFEAEKWLRANCVYELQATGSAANPGDVTRHAGVYLVTGGLGGLGRIFCRYLAERYRAHLVICGRSDPDALQQEFLAELQSDASSVRYVQCDLEKREDVANLATLIKQELGELHGIFHSAGTTCDGLIYNKSIGDVKRVLSSKTIGTLNLDHEFSNAQLDLFVLFSSIASVTGNAGQSDYAYANSFLDEFAAARNDMVAKHQRLGRTLSINWPYWSEGGMQVDADTLVIAKEQLGVNPISSQIGLTMWHHVSQLAPSSVLPVWGDASKTLRYLASRSSSTALKGSETGGDVNVPSINLREKITEYLKNVVSTATKYSIDKIDIDERFDSFGIDSVMVSQINVTLLQDIGELPKTLFYEQETIADLAGYLAKEHSSLFFRYFDLRPKSEDDWPTYEPLAPVAASINASTSALAASKQQSIAIVGLHGRYPQAATLNEFWNSLLLGYDAIEAVPSTRWDAQLLYSNEESDIEKGKIYCNTGGFLHDVDQFDSAFFNISEEEAKLIDPQERLFMESVWFALEDAGYTRESLRQKHPKGRSADVGVFVGVTTNSYQMLATEEWQRGNMSSPVAMPWSIANRVSYFFDFQGPSMPIDTACSSSLVAVHLACESIRNGECQVAIAGGVNLYLHPSKYLSLCHRNMLARHGKCRSFGDGDDGFIPGEGVGTVVLKSLDAAIADNDNIYAVVAGSGYEHSGRSNGYSAPNPNALSALIEYTLSKAHVSAEQINYVEAHGTGTQLGDSLEISALSKTFRKQTEAKQYCAIGSVKANIGHSESAAGIAGITKVLLQLKHKKLLPTIHCQPSNPNIDFANTPFKLQLSAAEWDSANSQPRHALVNAVGAGGVNACVLLGEWLPAETAKTTASRRMHVFVLSSTTREQLIQVCHALLEYLNQAMQSDLRDIAYTLQVGREAFTERLAVVADDTAGLLDALAAFVAGLPMLNTFVGRVEQKPQSRSSATENAADNNVHDSKEIAQAWVNGHSINWADLYLNESQPRRVTLPTFCFAPKRLWVSERAPQRTIEPMAKPAESARSLHPLISHNSSNLREISFCSQLSPTAFYAAEHRVSGQAIFPGALFLEIASMAGSLANEEQVTCIRDVIWAQPLVFDGAAQQLKTYLRTIGDCVEFEIVSFDSDADRIVHVEGKMSTGIDGFDKSSRIDLELYKRQSTLTRNESEHLLHMKRYGFEYGSHFQSVKDFYGNADRAVSRLEVSTGDIVDADEYLLAPWLLDGAFQTIAGLHDTSAQGKFKTYVPFAIDELRFIRPPTTVCFAVVEAVPLADGNGADLKKFNLSITDENGLVLISIKGFYVRPIVMPTHQVEALAKH